MYILFRGKRYTEWNHGIRWKVLGCTEGKMAGENKGASQLNRESFEITIMI